MSESKPLLPLGVPVPSPPEHELFRFEPLGAEHNERDHAAWTGSVDHIRLTPGFPNGNWPSPMSLADNLKDLERHANDFVIRKGFTWSILAPDSNRVIGCLYVYPSRLEGHDVLLPAEAL